MIEHDFKTLNPIEIPFTDTITIARRISRPKLRAVIWILNQVISDIESGEKIRVHSITKDKQHRINVIEQLKAIGLGKCLSCTDSKIILSQINKKKAILRSAHRERLFMVHQDEPRRMK